jgi:hypothetical protein
MSNVIRFIGDIHARFDRYKKIIAEVPRSVQLGDLGVGFRRLGGPAGHRYYINMPHETMARGDHRFIRGNHDNPTNCREHPQWIADGHFENGTMFIGGAVSVDRALRTEGQDWWPDEELSADELKEMFDLYIARRPRVMVTHDCPEEVSTIVLSRAPLLGAEWRDVPSRTRLAFQEMWSTHAPELWMFAHYHISFDHVLHGGRVTGTRFIGLAELEYRDIHLGSRSGC